VRGDKALYREQAMERQKLGLRWSKHCLPYPRLQPINEFALAGPQLNLTVAQLIQVVLKQVEQGKQRIT
jgi:hypothetical protein